MITSVYLRNHNCHVDHNSSWQPTGCCLCCVPVATQEVCARVYRTLLAETRGSTYQFIQSLNVLRSSASKSAQENLGNSDGHGFAHLQVETQAYNEFSSVAEIFVNTLTLVRCKHITSSSGIASNTEIGNQNVTISLHPGQDQASRPSH